MVLSFVIFLFYQQIRNLLKQILTSDQPLTDIRTIQVQILMSLK